MFQWPQALKPPLFPWFLAIQEHHGEFWLQIDSLLRCLVGLPEKVDI